MIIADIISVMNKTLQIIQISLLLIAVCLVVDARRGGGGGRGSSGARSR